MADLRTLMHAIAEADEGQCAALLAAEPGLARASLPDGATRADPTANYLIEIEHYIYAGDTALHIAAAAYRVELVGRLIALGAKVRAKNRRDAEPLHYAADGHPGSAGWNPHAQAATIAQLIAAGADPNAESQGGVTPLHRAVRTRCAAAVAALLQGGADPERTNAAGSTPLKLATQASGRGGSGSLEAKAQQAEIISLLEGAGA